MLAFHYAMNSHHGKYNDYTNLRITPIFISIAVKLLNACDSQCR
jgi:hypothetical protein